MARGLNLHPGVDAGGNRFQGGAAIDRVEPGAHGDRSFLVQVEVALRLQADLGPVVAGGEHATLEQLQAGASVYQNLGVGPLGLNGCATLDGVRAVQHDLAVAVEGGDAAASVQRDAVGLTAIAHQRALPVRTMHLDIHQVIATHPT